MKTRELSSDVQFDHTTAARGRNGWFRLYDGHLAVFANATYLDLSAKLHGKNAPIALTFKGPDDMRTLGRALLAAAETFDALRDPATAQLQEEYRRIADEEYRRDGELEFDPGCVVSLSEDGGAYVQGWTWIEGRVAGAAREA